MGGRRDGGREIKNEGREGKNEGRKDLFSIYGILFLRKELLSVKWTESPLVTFVSLDVQ